MVMDDLNLATREIYWNIPSSYKVVMYSLFLLSLAVLTKGFYEKAKFVTGGKPLRYLGGLLPAKYNWRSFFSTIFLTGKVLRDGKVSLFHSLIFYGFIVLLIATTLVAIDEHSPFKVYRGWTYIGISFLADAAGVAMLIGIALAFLRRYVGKPSYLSATKPRRELFMYAMLIALIVLGYALESLRIIATGMPPGEARWSPVGWYLAHAIGFFDLSDKTMGSSYRFIWMVHMINTMAFVALIPYSKFSHIILIPLSSLITPPRRGAVLSPMDFEDENAETFGLGKLSEMSTKNRFDLLSCVECGRCSQVCPALNAGKNLDPKTIITKARDLAENEGFDADIWSESIYSPNEIDACTTCGACMEECPANIEHVPIILEAKRYKALTQGNLPPTAADAVGKIRTNGNPWGIASEDRFKWAEGLDVPIIDENKKVDYLYYVGCAGSYDGANQKVVRDTVALLKKAGVDFAVIGKTEKCNGDPIRRFGDEYTFTEIAIENIAHMNRYNFDKVVTHCPHCLHTIGKEYAKFENGQFETIHHTELLADLIQRESLKTHRKIGERLTFHDPCYLGRHHGQYDAPRKILGSIPGIELKEMEKSKDKAVCCGMGGGNMWYELPEGEHLARQRLDDAAKTDTHKLATSCSYCMINFNSSKEEGLEVEDVASILARSAL